MPVATIGIGVSNSFLKHVVFLEHAPETCSRDILRALELGEKEGNHFKSYLLRVTASSAECQITNSRVSSSESGLRLVLFNLIVQFKFASV